jgi:hypothetical protein
VQRADFGSRKPWGITEEGKKNERKRNEKKNEKKRNKINKGKKITKHHFGVGKYSG